MLFFLLPIIKAIQIIERLEPPFGGQGGQNVYHVNNLTTFEEQI
jgi:hypothetical protein